MNQPESTPSREGRGFIIVGLVILWIASLAFILEILNLTVIKKFQVSFDPSFELSVAAFFLLLTVLGGLLVWRGVRERDRRPSDQVAHYLNVATFAAVVLLVVDTCAGGLIFSGSRQFLAEQQSKSSYIRPAPQPDSSLSVFPTPVPAQPTPTDDPSGKYLAGSVVGSIDHLRVGDVWISESPDGQSINYLQFTIQPVECTVMQAGKPATFAVQNSAPVITGPLPIVRGAFFASQEQAVIHGAIISPEEIMGTVYLRYSDPQTGRSCDLGNFEFDAFVSK